MRPLTLQQQIVFTFSSLATIALTVLTLGYSFLFITLAFRQQQQSMLEEATELATIFLEVRDGRVVYKTLDNGETLQIHLRTENTSLLVLNQNQELIGAFGVFAELQQENQSYWLEWATPAQNVPSGQYQFLPGTKSLAGQNYSLLVYGLTINGEQVGTAIIAKSQQELEKLRDLSLLITIVALPLGVGVSWLLGIIISRRILGPLTKLWQRVQLLHAGNLNHKIQLSSHASVEIQELADSFNSMLDRLHTSWGKQKEFVGNASHELRTPLTRAVSSLELAELSLKENDFQEALTEIQIVKKDLQQLDQILTELLALAATENTSTLLNYEPIRLKQFVEKIIPGESNWLIDIPAGVQIEIPPQSLQIILTNLISNAKKYSTPGSQISIRFEDKHGRGKLSVTNETSQVNRSEQSKLVQRFFRSRKARTSSTPGAGLGLAIVKEICEQLRLDFKVLFPETGQFRVEVSGFWLRP